MNVRACGGRNRCLSEGIDYLDLSPRAMEVRGVQKNLNVKNQLAR